MRDNNVSSPGLTELEPTHVINPAQCPVHRRYSRKDGGGMNERQTERGKQILNQIAWFTERKRRFHYHSLEGGTRKEKGPSRQGFKVRSESSFGL